MTGSAGVDVGLDSTRDSGPPEVGGDSVESLEITRMSGGGRVVELVKEAEAKSGISGYTDAFLEAPEAVGVKCEEGRSTGVLGRVVGVVGVSRLDVVEKRVVEDDMGWQEAGESRDEGDGGGGERRRRGVGDQRGQGSERGDLIVAAD